MAREEPGSTFSIRFLSPDDLRRGSSSDELRDVYIDAFTEPPYNEPASAGASFIERVQSEIDRPDWTLLVAEQNQRISGFAYGYVTEPGQWWHDRVSAWLEPELVQRWLTRSFVLVEFAVERAARGKGVGSRLHDGLLESLSHPTMVTMTHEHENHAVAFYRQRGWQVVADGFRFSHGDASRLILGREVVPDRSAF